MTKTFAKLNRGKFELHINEIPCNCPDPTPFDEREFMVFIGAPEPSNPDRMIWKRKGKVRKGTEMEFVIGLIEANGWSIFELGGMPVTKVSEEDLRNELENI